MQVIKIKADSYTDHLTELISDRLSLLKSLSVPVKCRRKDDTLFIEYDEDQYIDLQYGGTGNISHNKSINGLEITPITSVVGPKRSLLRLSLSSAIARVIRERIAVEYISDRINELCNTFTAGEKARILDDTIRSIYSSEVYQEIWQRGPDAESQTTDGDYIMTGEYSSGNSVKVDHVFMKLYEYLSISNELILEGFLQFRLKPYFVRLKRTVYRAIDDFLFDQQYEEFVKLLSHFVDIQVPRIDTVTVAKDTSGYLRFYDTEGNQIDTDQLLGGLGDLTDGDLNVEDILIGLLIALSPQKVFICMRGAHVLFETTLHVFEGRIVVCDACSCCKLFSKDKQSPGSPSKVH